jgi:hypothetical protein
MQCWLKNNFSALKVAVCTGTPRLTNRVRSTEVVVNLIGRK